MSSIVQSFIIALAKTLVQVKLIDKDVLRKHFIEEREIRCAPYSEYKPSEADILQFLDIKE